MTRPYWRWLPLFACLCVVILRNSSKRRSLRFLAFAVTGGDAPDNLISISREIPMSAAYALPGDVIQIKDPIPIQDRNGMVDELTPGYYAVMGQLDERLVLARTGEDEGGDLIASGEPFAVPVAILETDAVGITYLKAERWMRTDTESL
jgi:hypothetical protein